MSVLLFLILVISSQLLPFHSSTSFQDLIPEALRARFGEECGAIQDAGQRGVCELLSATSTQVELISSSSSRNNRSSSKTRGKHGRCQYTEQAGSSFHKYATRRSPELEALLAKYTEMHRRCISEEYADLWLLATKKASPRTKCRYLVWSCSFGLGNRLMSLVSAFLYALISQRVLLVNNPGWSKLFCQPFEGSEWLIPGNLTLPRPYGDSFSRYYDGDWKRKAVAPGVVPVFFTSTTPASEHRFLVCPAALRSVRDVPFLNFMNSNQYYAPAFFLNPALQPVMGALFPDLKVFHNLASFLLIPSNRVWSQVSSSAFLNPNATRRFGVQLRDFSDRYTSYFDKAVPLCISSHLGICPIEMEARRSLNSNSNSNSTSTSDSNLNSNSNMKEKQQQQQQDLMPVYLATMIAGHSSRIQSRLREMSATELVGVSFELTSQAPDGQQLDDAAHQEKALADIWLLSFSDVLLTTRLSTFGYAAAGISGSVPLQMTHWANDPCIASLSSDPCFHFAPRPAFRCDDDAFAIGSGPSRGLTIAWTCRDMPGSGMQLREEDIS